MTRHRTPMSAVDKAWLRMETSANPMMIGIVLIFDSPIPMGAFRHLLEERFLKYRRFRQKVVVDGERAWWEDDPYFDLDNHLHQIALPGNADKAALQHLASDFNSSPLDLNKPLWQIHYIDRYEGGCALMVRIHHCIADGISLVRVLLSLTDENPQTKVTPMHKARPSLPVPGHRLTRHFRRWQNNLDMAREQAGRVVNRAWKDPGYLLKLGKTGLDVSLECLRLGLMPSDPPTPLKGELCGRKRVAWAEPLSMAEVKETAKALGGTVNDVLMATATGALRDYLHQAGEEIPPNGIRVAVPFNLRPLRQPIETLGNQFGLVLVPLPVDLVSPLARFHQVQQEMNRLKRSSQAQITYSLLDIFGRGPDLLERRALELLSQKASAVMTNVPGPRKPLYLAGCRLVQPMFWVPQTGGVGVGLSIFSYHDTVQFGLISDKRLIDCPDDVVAGFVENFEKLRQLAIQEDPTPNVKPLFKPLNIA
ncbi:WS/DGAT/MGAT family O-acyltransferase [Mangrovitalea sediminis]|uniref:WS/DGAT/MGAT family O-acyltransferase n=1 Tax=Mangrovitalea sediminis TaxID=1982043 RepID=UPI000BE4F863|nr:wax ester/triacylglycerol synthase family O-acyltransferase [Mangrovitalea sediminis]